MHFKLERKQKNQFLFKDKHINYYMQKKLSVILFCFDQYYNLINNMIKSFNDLNIYKFYILCFDTYSIIESNKIVNIDMRKYNYNVNKCYNDIKSESDMWLIWKSSYYFDSNKLFDFQSIVNSIEKNNCQICFICGIKLFLDIYHINNQNQYACKNGGCCVISNIVNMNESEIYFSIDKDKHKINYKLENSDTYFFDMTFATTSRLMLVSDFEFLYMQYLKNNPHMTFENWYEKTNNKIQIGSSHIEKKYKFEGTQKKEKHNYDLPFCVTSWNTKNNFSMTYVIVVSNFDEFCRLYMTIESLENQKTRENKWNILIIFNGNFGNNFFTTQFDFIKVLYINEKITVADCYDIAVNNTCSDIVTFIKSGITFQLSFTQHLIDSYNNSHNLKVFVYPGIINKSIQIDCAESKNKINDCFVSIKKQYYSKITKNSFCNENLNILLNVETICRPISLFDTIDIKNCKTNETTKIEKYIYNNLIKKNNECNVLNAYFEKIFVYCKNNYFDENNINYELTNLTEKELIEKYEQICFSILIVKTNDKYNYEKAFEELLNKYQDFNKIIFDLNITGYIFNKQNKTYYVKHNEFLKVDTFDPFPKVSIIMTVYNKELYVENAIKSVLKQSYKNLELIIVEDFSTDNSKQIVKKFENLSNVKIIYNAKNLGCYSSRNIGIVNSSGTIIGFQDADDYTLENRITNQINLMLSKNLMMVGCNMIRSHIQNIKYDSDELILKDVSLNIKHFNSDCCNEMFGYPTLLIKKNLFDELGKYIERPKGMDMEFPERVMFYKIGKKFNGSSWQFFDQESNQIYEKLNELLVISPEMNQSNITNNLQSDDYLKNKSWRDNYI